MTLKTNKDTETLLQNGLPFTEEEGPLIRQALLIRRVEEKLLELFAEGKLNGTVHTCIGQEWSAVAVMQALEEKDTVFSTHRGHGHYIARTGDVNGLIAEIMGKETGVCGGVGGSQHIHAPNYYSNGIQGGMMPVASGKALAAKLDGNDAISVIFIGDGTLGEGTLYESLNIASKWELPLLVVVENNGYAQSTDSSTTIAGTVKGRAKGFGITYKKADTWNRRELLSTADDAVGFVRDNGKPLVLEVETFRLKAHSKGDDNRDRTFVAEYENKDFINQLLSNNGGDLESMLREIDDEIDEAVAFAETSADCSYRFREPETMQPVVWEVTPFTRERVVNIIHKTLEKQFTGDTKKIMIGEDIEGEYGGAFKVTKNMSLQHPGRVRNTPISEAAITGIGSGLALGGYKAFVEIMFGDFMTLTFDQIFQHASKFCEMYGRQLDLPLIIRTPMGGKRGYGPTHSQSIEKFFLGIPNIDIIALNIRVSPALIYERLCDSIRNPTIVIENKILYTRFLKTEPIPGFIVRLSDELFPTVRISPENSQPDVTVVCYGGMLEDAEEAIQKVFDEEEIISEIICPARIHPLNITTVLESVGKTGRLVTVEEGSKTAALSSEIAARIAEEGVALKSFTRVGNDHIIPSSFEREIELLPGVKSIINAVKEAVT